MEVTKWLKPSNSVLRIGDSASGQAAEKVTLQVLKSRVTDDGNHVLVRTHVARAFQRHTYVCAGADPSKNALSAGELPGDFHSEFVRDGNDFVGEFLPK